MLFILLASGADGGLQQILVMNLLVDIEIVYILSGSLLVLPLLPSCNFCFFESGVDMEHLTFSRRATGPSSGTLVSLPIAGTTPWMVGSSELANFLCTQKWKAYFHSILTNVALPFGANLNLHGIQAGRMYYACIRIPPHAEVFGVNMLQLLRRFLNSPSIKIEAFCPGVCLVMFCCCFCSLNSRVGGEFPQILGWIDAFLLDF